MNYLTVTIILLVIALNFIFFKLLERLTFDGWAGITLFIIFTIFVVLAAPFIVLIIVANINSRLSDLSNGIDGSAGGGFIVFCYLLLFLTLPITTIMKFFVIPRLRKL